MHVRCRFGRNDRFLASVQLSIGVLLDAELRGGSLTYGVEIVPVLVSMEQSAHVDFPLASPDTAALIAWVEGRLLAFLHFYLGLETDTHYQRTDSAVDPVCGMRLTPATACTRIAEHAHTWYFCSDACRTRFEADRDLYVKQDGHWRAVGTATGAPGVDGVGP